MRVAAVIVTHGPDLARMGALAAALRPQVDALVIVDNASDATTLDALRTLAGLHAAGIVANTRNLGVGEALNQGIRHARSLAADAVLLMDQDSLPQPQMVAALMNALDAPDIGAAGPVAIDERTGQPAPFIRIGAPFNRKLNPATGVVDCDFLITSGTLVPLAVIDVVGDMDSALFIDNVDLDWSFRARARGFRLRGVADARMVHRIGDRLQPRPGGKAIIHGPTRLYYIMRNRLLMYRRPATPVRWIAQDLPRLVLKFLGFSLVVAPRRINARAMLEGLFDGARGRSGPRPNLD